MNKYVFDTSSLVMLVRYFLPFDNEKLLVDYFVEQFKEQHFIILDKVYEECLNVSKKIVYKELLYKVEKKIITTFEKAVTDEMHNIIDNHFAIKREKDKLNDDEYEIHRRRFIYSADFKLVHYAKENNAVVITEESRAQNDGKCFKKIPLMCDYLDIEYKNIVKVLQEIPHITLDIQKYKVL